MRASTVVTIFCFATSIAPSLATSSEPSSEHTKRKLNYKQTASYGLVAATVNAVIATSFVAAYAGIVARINPNAKKLPERDVLELLDAQINQELASRAYKRAVLSMPLGELD